MTFQEEVSKLSENDRERLLAILEDQGVKFEDLSDLMSFKILLQGQKFHGTVPADFAHSLWGLQKSYYRMVAAVKYGSPTATLSAEEKQEHLLVFKIENGSTLSMADLSGSFWDVACKLVDKMEPWQILLLAAILGSAYVGGKIVKHRADVNKRKTEISADLEERKAKISADLEERKAKISADLEERKAEISADAEKRREDAEMFISMCNAHKEALDIVTSAGADARKTILRGVSGIERASIGGHTYDAAEIAKIRRRAARVKSKSETRTMNVMALDILASDKEKPTVVLLDKETGVSFKAEISLGADDDVQDASFNETALNIIWDSARYPDRYFWAEISVVLLRDKIIEATILAAAENKEDLPESSEPGTDELDI